MLTTKRKPATVGEMLVEEFMQPIGLTQSALAEAMGVQRKHVNELCNDRRNVTAATALILARVFGNSPDFWLNVQRRNDLWEAMNCPARAQADRACKAAGRRGLNALAVRSGARPAPSPRPVLVEEVVHELRRRGVEARRLFEIREARLGDVLGGAEGEQERALARRPDAGDFVERAFHEFLLAPRAMGSDRRSGALRRAGAG